MVTQQSGALGGQLGSRTQLDSTFHGSDPETVAAAAICSDTPTKCQARTRLYRDGTLVAEGFPVSEISDHLTDERTTIWLDLRDPDPGTSPCSATSSACTRSRSRTRCTTGSGRRSTGTAPTCS